VADGPWSLLARAIAREAHEGQVDKAGRPYIEHPARVAARVRDAGGDDEAQAAAWLHDTVEDSGVTLEDLRRRGFSRAVVDAVAALTRREDLTDDLYYADIKTNSVALAVKAADIADNADPARLALLEPALQKRLTSKYQHAREALGITQ
jgi:(p)ppGpp synthase/HD superfamily hydrolase